jgi:cyclophilin family peptidyl-prolyl cis-trans isomerase
MKRLSTILVLITAIGLRAADLPSALPDGLYAEVTTPRGIVVAELHFKQAPMTVANYVGLAEGTLGPRPGLPFFDGLTFHRVVEDFVVQGGDPTGTGDGGPGYSFPDEIVPGLRHDRAGVVQMANDGPDTNGSQWCFMLREVNRLNYLHSVFGHVVHGLEVLPKIQQGDTMRVKILRVGKDAEAFRVTGETFAAQTNKAVKYVGPMEPGPDAPFDDPDKILPTDWPRAQAFNFKLANFERFTGRRIRARVLARTPADKGTMSRYLRGVSSRLDTDEHGALAVYCADQDEWHLWFGEKDLALLAGDKLAAEGASKSEVMREAKAAFLAETKARTAAAVAYAQKRLPPGETVPPAQQIKLSVDSVLDGLIFRFEQPQGGR